MFTFRRVIIPLVASALAFASLSTAAAEAVFIAKLAGANQLPEPTSSKATGTLELKVSADGKQVHYVLTVVDISNVSGADVHLGPPTANGPLVLKLFPKEGVPTKKGPFTGVLAEGTVTADDLTGPMQGSPLSDFIEELQGGNVYTNVHTNDGVDPPNSGPGDFRLGEIRGQLKAQ